MKLAVRQTARAGRGLFAAEAARAGDVLDTACTNELSPADCVAIDPLLPLGDYYFQHPEHEASGVLIFGLASLCNHADPPSAELRFRRDPEAGLLADLVAVRDLENGDQITLRYRCALWFPPAD